jgi:ribosomal-protein-alanine N-acetyltransferase
MSYLVDLAQQHHCRVAHLEVRQSNAAARAFYQRLGFRATGVRRNYYGPNEDALLMSKKLSDDTVAHLERSQDGLV